MIKCSECEHENEAQRVYCHNCGARLDRTALVEEAQKPKKAVKPKKRLSPDAASNLQNFFKVLIYSALAAAVLQAFRPPDGAPKSRGLGETIVDAPFLSVDLEQAALSPRRLAYSEAQLNAYLRNRVKPSKDSAIPTWLAVFNQAYVNLGEGSGRLTKEFFLFTLPFHVGGTYLPEIGPEGFQAKSLGGHIGRLPIHASLFDLVDNYIFADFIKNMAEEAKSAGKAKSIQVTPKMVVITSGQAKL